MNSNFILLNKTKQTIDYYEKILVNHPKEDRILSDAIKKNCYELVECLYAYNINDVERVKNKYLKDYLIKLGMLDFYTNNARSKKSISIKQFEVITNFIIEARKITYGLMNGKKVDDKV